LNYSIIGTDGTYAEREEFRDIFNDLLEGEHRMLAYELVFTLTVFKGLTGKTFAIDDKILIRNIQSGILYKDEAAQGKVNKVNNIMLIKNEELTSTENVTDTSNIVKQIKQPASDIQTIMKKEDEPSIKRK